MATATLWDTATRVGHLAWYSRQLSSLLGAWARDDRTPELARMFATMSNHHADLAAACTARLPSVALVGGGEWTPEQFVAAPDLADEQLLLRSADAAGADARRRAAERLLTLAYDWAVEQGTLVDKVLDEPTADLLDTVITRIETQLLAIGGGKQHT